MVQLTNTAPQTVAAGASVLYNADVFRSRCNDSTHREGSGGVSINRPGVYEISFSANIGLAAGTGRAALAIQLDGDQLGETVMFTPTNTACDLSNVSTSTLARITCCGGSERVSVVNVGAGAVTVANPSIIVKRVG